MTRPWLGDGPFSYRFWSATFGVAAVLVTFLIARIIFNLRVAVGAGLLLAFNDDFLFNHGSRFAGMDAMLTFFVGLGVLLYLVAERQILPPLPAWIGAGCCFGLAALSKPPVFAIFFFLSMCGAHLLSTGVETFALKIKHLLIAALSAVTAASPWYVAIYKTLGINAIYQLFVFNSVDRSMETAGKNLFVCFDAVFDSSFTFKLAFLALGIALVASILPSTRQQYRPLTMLSLPFLLVLTAVGRGHNYIFYAFPFVAVAIAAVLLELLPQYRLKSLLTERRAKLCASLALMTLLCLDGTMVIRSFRRPEWIHPPLNLYSQVDAHIKAGDIDLILLGFPRPQQSPCFGSWQSNYEDVYYERFLVGARHAWTLAELKHILNIDRPFIIIQSPYCSLDLSYLNLCDTVCDVKWPAYHYRLYTNAATLPAMAGLLPTHFDSLRR